jgi:predicted aspartyl protease
VGKVIVPAKIENFDDVKAAMRGVLPEDQIRKLDIPNARIDTGATVLSMPKRLIEQLGLMQLKTAEVKTAMGLTTVGVYEPVRLTIQGRGCEVSVTEVADTCPVLIGFIPLELLDFLVDSKNQRLIGNPEHDGKFMIDMYHEEFCV